MSTDPHVEELIGVYALGALTRDERQAVERHLATCAACRALAADAQAATRTLPFEAEPAAPAPQLKQRLMARIAADVAAADATARARVDGDAAAAASRARIDAPIAPARPRPAATGRSPGTARLRWAWPAAAVAALALIVVLGWWGWTQQNELNAARAELEILSRPDLHVVSLPAAKPTQGGAQARLFVAPDSTIGLLAVSGLQPLPAQQTYQFWLIRNGKPVPAGIFNVTVGGGGRLVVQSADPLGQFDQAGVTVEVAGGTQTPTMEALVFVGPIR